MEAGGKYSILVIYTGFHPDAEFLLVEAAGRSPINETYDPVESKRTMEFQYKVERAARGARRRMAAARREGGFYAWISPVRVDEFVGG